MYEAPMKRAGLSMNRILYSNTKMVHQGFPNLDGQKFRLAFKYRTFENGKVATMQCKYQIKCFMVAFLRVGFDHENLDEVLPPRK